jgi:hypothetical protein
VLVPITDICTSLSLFLPQNTKAEVTHFPTLVTQNSLGLFYTKELLENGRTLTDLAIEKIEEETNHK